MTDDELYAFRRFRTGLSYQAVWRMLFIQTDDRTKWVQKSPGAVLRFWHQLKLDMWHEWLGGRTFDEFAELAADDFPASPLLRPPPPEGRVADVKVIQHRGRTFAVTYWVKSPASPALNPPPIKAPKPHHFAPTGPVEMPPHAYPANENGAPTRSHGAPQSRPGRVPVRKEIEHRGRRFWVTYWVKSPQLTAVA